MCSVYVRAEAEDTQTYITTALVTWGGGGGGGGWAQIE